MAHQCGLETINITTMRHDVGFGDKMVTDLRQRLSLTLSDWNADQMDEDVVPFNIEDRIEKLLGFLQHVGPHLGGMDSDLVGATVIGRFSNNIVVMST